jgi:hypothetical protein
MKDFLDVLLEQMDKKRSAQDEAVYINRLRSLATTAPPLRLIPSRGSGSTLRAATAKTAPDSRFFQARPDVELFFYELKDELAEPRWFRLAKDLDPTRAFGRWDPVANEAQVLETIAMGADLYSLRVSDHDAATLQYLAEVGVDYGVPVCCVAVRKRSWRARSSWKRMAGSVWKMRWRFLNFLNCRFLRIARFCCLTAMLRK